MHVCVHVFSNNWYSDKMMYILIQNGPYPSEPSHDTFVNFFFIPEQAKKKKKEFLCAANYKYYKYSYLCDERLNY